jgi:hypothetical protein
VDDEEHTQNTPPIQKLKRTTQAETTAPPPLFPIAPGFESSFSAKITNMRIVLAFVKNYCGYVQKIAAVAVVLSGTVRIPCPSRLLIPLM